MNNYNCENSFNSLATPIYRGSTIVFNNFKSFEERRKRQPDGFSYGITGSPTHRELENVISELECAKHTIVLPSGQSALVLVLMATLKNGDHVVVSDSCYGPVRNFLTENLTALGIEVTFVPPRETGFLRKAIQDNTRLIMLESPSSLTMEVQDTEEIVRIAQQKNILTVMDNSWAGPLLFKPMKFGADFVVEAVSKMLNGHSDILLGSISTKDIGWHAKLRNLQDVMGMYVSPDDCYLALRGIETYPLRQEKHSHSARIISQWLENHPAISSVLHPGLASSEDNALYNKYFEGYGSVFSFTLKNEKRLDDFFNALSQFRIGASYGGTVSLIAYYSVETLQSRSFFKGYSSLIRVSIGLEDSQRLIDDLDYALQKTL
ncbi:PLP-dependent transferase [Dickeya ananatis]|uniref:trans-sulfuration enzyme family protein n=1 Tax=Dickeya ananatis TaxID=3061286 RepID=UPI001CE4D10B|nr:PLP-dependent transferase [Dickeya zeae]